MEYDKLSPVRVGVREAPFRSFLGRQEPSIVHFSPEAGNSLVVDQNDYHFDHAFRSTVSQLELYGALIMPLVGKVFCGFECTVMAYGQTGTGKSYSMGMTADNQATSEEHLGVLPRCLCDILDRVAAKQENTLERIQVSASYIEIYNEKAYDLLAATPMDPMLASRSDSCTCLPLASQEDLQRLLQLGNNNRHVRRTNMNANSSRSHAIVTIHLRRQGGQLSRMNIVDLAGSEGVRRTGHEGVARQEGVSINMGLLSVNKVVLAMAAGHAVIPYRDSVLTTVLQKSLTSQSYLTLLACISPHACDLSETISTLRFAKSAKRLRLNPQQLMMSRNHQLQQQQQRVSQPLVELLVAGAQEAGALQVGAATRFDQLADSLQVRHILAPHRHNWQHHHGQQQAHGGLGAHLRRKGFPRQQLLHALAQPERAKPTVMRAALRVEGRSPGQLLPQLPMVLVEQLLQVLLSKGARGAGEEEVGQIRHRRGVAHQLPVDQSQIERLRESVHDVVVPAVAVADHGKRFAVGAADEGQQQLKVGSPRKVRPQPQAVRIVSGRAQRTERTLLEVLEDKSRGGNHSAPTTSDATGSCYASFFFLQQQQQQTLPARTPHALRRPLSSSTTVKVSRPTQHGAQNSYYLMAPKPKESMPLMQLQRTRSEMGLTPKAKKRAREELQLEMTMDAPSDSHHSAISLVEKGCSGAVSLSNSETETTLVEPLSGSNVTLKQEQEQDSNGPMGPPQPPPDIPLFHSSLLSIAEEPDSQQQKLQQRQLLFDNTCSPIVPPAAGPLEMSGIQPLEISDRPVLRARRFARLNSNSNRQQSSTEQQQQPLQQNQNGLRRSMRLAVKLESAAVTANHSGHLATQDSGSAGGSRKRSRAAIKRWINKQRITFLNQLNTADERELKKLPGIGGKTAFTLVLQRGRLGGFQSLRQVQELPIWTRVKWTNVCSLNGLDPYV
ncbi:kinesin-like protein Nod [Drosophila subobscura]|uniref:kinesin-like protein Nod n=1 Tax=Drosophila subobscura TaxID=7241 RepID=UPI00155B0492|nr:kinesin-like protein Nod [Drosophila subobscura]